MEEVNSINTKLIFDNLKDKYTEKELFKLLQNQSICIGDKVILTPIRGDRLNTSSIVTDTTKDGKGFFLRARLYPFSITEIIGEKLLETEEIKWK